MINFFSVSDTLAGRLQTWRRSLRLTQAEVARKLGLERATYVNYEYGRAAPPSHVLKSLVKLGFDPNADTDPFKLPTVSDPWQIRATPRQVAFLIDVLARDETPTDLRQQAKAELMHALGLTSQPT